jgi:hypothetical protein
MQLLTVSAAVSIVAVNPTDSSTQYEILLSVTDASGNQINDLGKNDISCFVDPIEGVGIAAATVTTVEPNGKGLYRVLATPGTQNDPRLIAVIVEQHELAITVQGQSRGEGGIFHGNVVARGQVAITVFNRAGCCSLNPPVNNVPQVFENINPNGMPIIIDCTGVPISDLQGNKGHFQGIQRLRRGSNDSGLLVITSSSASKAFFVACEMADDGVSGRAYSPMMMSSFFKHAGGCQAVGHCLAAGVEDPDSNSLSQVQFWDFRCLPKQLTSMTIPRSGPQFLSTAGAVGLTSFGNGAVLVVGGYNSANIDFYKSDADPFRGSPFEFQTRWNAYDAFPHYQNLNLITDTSGQLYMIAFYRDGDSKDWMDLYSIDLDDATVAVTQVGISKHMTCIEPSNFNAGAGIYIPSSDAFEVYAVSYYASGGAITVNHFTPM